MMDRIKLELRLFYNKSLENTQIWIAWHMPRSMVTWCAIRLMAHATQGQWGMSSPTELDCVSALNRWDIKHATDQAPGQQPDLQEAR